MGVARKTLRKRRVVQRQQFDQVQLSQRRPTVGLHPLSPREVS